MAKSAMCAAPLGAVSTVGYFLVSYMQSEWTTAENSGKVYEDGTMGKIYGKYLLGTGKENKKAWEEVFTRLEQGKLSSSVLGTHITNQKFSEESHVNAALNNACEIQYKKQMKTENKQDGVIDPTQGEWKDIWMLCSTWNPKWLTPDATHDENSIGKLKSHEILSTNEEDNRDLWKVKNNDFFSLETSPTEKVFKELYDKGKNTSSNLKEACKEAYKTKPGSDGTTQPSADAVLKYCSMKPIV